MLTTNTLLPNLQTRSFLKSTAATSPGRLTPVNSKNIIQNMVATAIRESIWLSFQKPKSKSRKPLPKPKQKYLVRKQTHLKKPFKKYKNGVKNTKMPKTFQKKYFQRATILEI